MKNKQDIACTNLHIQSYYLQGARQVLMTLHDLGKLILDDCNGKDAKIYNDAAYELLMSDEMMLLEWLGGPNSARWYYCDHEKNNKGKLIKCKAKRQLQ